MTVKKSAAHLNSVFMGSGEYLLYLLESAVVCAALLILALYGSKIAGSGDNCYLALDNTLPIRGLLAICIVLHHGSGYFTRISFISPLQHIGYLVVALFFFLSGYGLSYGLKNKKGYMDGFLKKRLISVLIPYWIGNMVYCAGVYLMGEQIEAKSFILSMLLLKVINGPMWYVQLQVLFYLQFYVSFAKKDNWPLFYTLFFVLYVGAFSAGIDEVYTRSALAFPLGLMWCNYQDKIDKTMDAHYWIGLMGAAGITVLFFCLKFTGVLIGSDLMKQLGSNISAVAFCVSALWITKKIRISNQGLRFLGSISYEIYLIHMLALNCAGRIPMLREHPLIFFVFSIAVIIVLAVVLNRADHFVIKKING